MKRSLRTALILLLIAIVGIALADERNKIFEITKNIEIFSKVYQELNDKYVDEIDPGELMKIGIDAMVNSLDPYTVFYSANLIERHRFQAEDAFDGLGAKTEMVDGQLTIIEPYQGYAADRAGLKAGDRVLQIQGEDLTGKSEEEIRSRLKGAAGTEITLTIQSYGDKQSREIKVVRSEFNRSNVPYSGMVDEEVGYIVLTTFTRNAAVNIRKALSALREEHPSMKSLILDLRNNGGGLLNEAVDICNIFVPKDQEIVSTKGKVIERDRSYRTSAPAVDEQIPLAILINGNSASASEIVSGVIQDLDRGVLIGERTYGKGLVQNNLQLGYNNNLKLTTAKYYIPSGRCIQSVAYEHGEPVHIPDDQRAVFKTKSGRKVLDGGGVDPDLEVKEQEIPQVVKALIRQHLIFKFVNEYTHDIEAVGDPKSYRFHDYDQFKSFLQKVGFTYESSSEKLVAELKQQAEAESSTMSTMIQSIEELLEQSKMSALDTYRDLIIQRIESEIITRYHYEEGRIQQRLDADPELHQAIEVLKDQKRYEALLRP